MTAFDASKNWVILVPPGSPAVKKAAQDLSRCIALLREPGRPAPELADVSWPYTEPAPVFLLNNGSHGPDHNGFSWRTGPGRIEIFGESERGLRNGIYDFLSALDISWPMPDFSGNENKPAAVKETLPPFRPGGSYPLKSANIHEPSILDSSSAFAALRRFVIPEKSPIPNSPQKLEVLAVWAARNKFDAVVFPFSGLGFAEKNNAGELFASCGLSVEAGGWELSLLVPRKLFLFHKDLFRMESGKRKKNTNFCPTNHKTIEIIKAEGEKLFRKFPGIKVFNLWPDRPETEAPGEKLWCSCPSCRAFSPAEQNIIAVNAAAAALAEVSREAFVSLYETSDDEVNVPLRTNVFRAEPQLVIH